MEEKLVGEGVVIGLSLWEAVVLDNELA